MKISELSTGDLFIFSSGLDDDFYLKVDSGYCSMETESLCKDSNLAKNVIKIERWVVYKNYMLYEMSQPEVDHIINRLIQAYRYPHSVKEAESMGLI